MRQLTVYKVVSEFAMLNVQVQDDGRTCEVDDGCQIRLVFDRKLETKKSLKKRLQNLVYFS